MVDRQDDSTDLRPVLPLTIRHTYRAASATYRHHFGEVALVAVLVFLPLSTIDTLVDRVSDQQHEVGTLGPLLVALTALSILDIVANFFGTAFYSGLLDRIVGHHHYGHEFRSVPHTLRSLPYRSLVPAALLVTALEAAGYVLFVIPGLILTTLLAIVAPLINIEGLRPVAALRRSVRLVRPHFWLTFVAVTVPLLIEDTVDDWVDHHLAASGLVPALLGGFALDLTVLPFVALVEVVLAYQLVERDRPGLVRRDLSAD